MRPARHFREGIEVDTLTSRQLFVQLNVTPNYPEANDDQSITYDGTTCWEGLQPSVENVCAEVWNLAAKDLLLPQRQLFAPRRPEGTTCVEVSGYGVPLAMH